MVEEKIENKVSVGFGVNDCPFWAYNRFKKVAQEKFNDVHWVRLVDLLEKESAYESLLNAINNGLVNINESVDYKSSDTVTTPEVVEVKKKKYLGEK